jgi:endonuclease YncB( thermonuclease family)
MKLILLLIIFNFYQVKEYSGKIVYVIDGDTFILQTTEERLKIRMDCIDAPEKDQDFGSESKNFLERFLYKECKVFSKSSDLYGRTIGMLYVDNINVNLLSIREGFSWHYKKYSSDSVFTRAEIKAREGKKGLWSNSEAIAPWVWRILNK